MSTPDRLLPGPFQHLATLLEERQRDIDHFEELGGGVYALCGTVVLPPGAGEFVIPVNFPLTFTERPNFTFGGELQDSSPVINGRLPTISAVARWRYKTRTDSGGQQYIGATFLIVTTGTPDQLMVMHYRMEAKALRGPGGPVVMNPPAHPLLGPLFGIESDGTVTPGSLLGATYVGTADFDPASVVYAADGVTIPVDPNYAAPDYLTKTTFLHPAATTDYFGAPFNAGTIILAVLPISWAAQPQQHSVSVTVTDVNGVTDSRTWYFYARQQGTT